MKLAVQTTLQSIILKFMLNNLEILKSEIIPIIIITCDCLNVSFNSNKPFELKVEVIRVQCEVGTYSRQRQHTIPLVQNIQ